MRLWSISTTYLDSIGLVALWREALLARTVLKGETKGYRNHPQLVRFKKLNNPVNGINAYLETVYDESVKRKYKFSSDKLEKTNFNEKIFVSRGQVEFEFEHLLRKLKTRDKTRYKELEYIKDFKTNPLFMVKDGGVDIWERGNKINI